MRYIYTLVYIYRSFEKYAACTNNNEGHIALGGACIVSASERRVIRSSTTNLINTVTVIMHMHMQESAVSSAAQTCTYCGVLQRANLPPWHQLHYLQGNNTSPHMASGNDCFLESRVSLLSTPPLNLTHLLAVCTQVKSGSYRVSLPDLHLHVSSGSYFTGEKMGTSGKSPVSTNRFARG